MPTFAANSLRAGLPFTSNKKGNNDEMLNPVEEEAKGKLKALT